MRKPKEPEPKSEEFARFRELAGKIVAVPKAETDKLKKQQEKAKGKGPATK